ncbi:phosphoribosylanthranilate isomerase [Alkalicoccobacillus gibsonii]|uniref:phosphoribosylanthranilate isomerase n=1 Tax=Alkalicoccobacillus gibsonii TaxID=79881 RepID=UPI003F7CB5A3
MRPLLKYCGNRSEDDLALTKKSKADYLGFVFVPGTKRFVRAEDVNRWLVNQPVTQQKLVALFVNESIETITSVCTICPIDIIQCHGTESSTTVAKIKQATKKEVWKVIHHHKHGVSQMKEYDGIADGYIIDTKVAGSWGGTGQTFDWESIPNYLSEGKRQSVPVFIAGGVNAENISALTRYKPDGIDLSSGLERENKKSYEAIREIERELFRDDEL